MLPKAPIIEKNKSNFISIKYNFFDFIDNPLTKESQLKKDEKLRYYDI